MTDLRSEEHIIDATGKIAPGCSQCLVVLCGLPASGKTELASAICSSRGRTHERLFSSEIIHICYDDFIPDNLELNSAVETDKFTRLESGVSWKQLRLTLYGCLEDIISHQTSYPHISSDLDLTRTTSTDGIKAEWKERILKQVYSDGDSTDGTGKNVCWLYVIDDNMFYRSMRYDYYQLARKYGIGFCEIYLKCALSIAMERNQQRKEPIPCETLVTMETRLEPPDGTKYSWEENSIALDGNKILDESVLARVWDLVKTALLNPVIPLQAEDMEEKEASREAIAASIVYQADQILRKCIADHMKQIKGNLTKVELKEQAKQLAQVKCEILDDLRNCKLRLDMDVDDLQSGLHKQITTIFQKNVSGAGP